MNSNMAEERARDLADYAALMLEWSEYYDNLLMSRDYTNEITRLSYAPKRWGLSIAETEWSRDN